MASQVENWVGAQQDGGELEEAASLSDFPVDVETPNSCTNGEATESIDSEDFEFRTFGSGGSGSGGDSLKLDDDHMCAADEVFFQGQILPLRPSVSSRTESMDRFCGTSRSLGFDGSSRSISRSQSTHSSSSSFSISSSEAGSRHSISSNFYSHPSPKPHLPARSIPRRKSISSPTGGALGWGVLRLGPVKAPQIDLPDLRQRKASITNGSSVNGGSKRHDRETKSEKEENCNAKDRKGEKRTSIMRFLLRKLSCSCSTTSEVMEPKNCCSNLRRREEGSVSLRHSSSRTFQWLEDLSVAKAQVV